MQDYAIKNIIFNTMAMKKISIIGAGGWGTTLAVLVAENGYDVTLWAREKEIVQSINEKRE